MLNGTTQLFGFVNVNLDNCAYAMPHQMIIIPVWDANLIRFQLTAHTHIYF